MNDTNKKEEFPLEGRFQNLLKKIHEFGKLCFFAGFELGGGKVTD